MDTRHLDGRTALVTGSSRGLGAEIAGELANRGASVAVTYRTSEHEAQALVDRLRAATDREHVALDGDMTDPEAVESVIDRVGSRLGGVDILVNNAGPYTREPLTTLPVAEWDRILDANLRSAFVASQRCAPGMRARGWGRIVNVSAVSAQVANRSIYGLAKRAVEHLTESLACELAPEITVNAISPGQIQESADDMAAFDPTWPEVAKQRTPLGRLGTRSELAQVVAAICGPTFHMLTGATIPLDGGLRFNRF